MIGLALDDRIVTVAARLPCMAEDDPTALETPLIKVVCMAVDEPGMDYLRELEIGDTARVTGRLVVGRADEVGMWPIVFLTEGSVDKHMKVLVPGGEIN